MRRTITEQHSGAAPSLSVVVPTHNRLAILRETVARVLACQVPGEQREVIVVNDHSTDGTGEWLRAVAEREPGLQVVNPEGRGRAQARNAGLAAARGELVIFLDDDMWVGPEFLEAHWAAYLETRPEPVVCVGKMRPYPGNEPTLANLAYDRRLAHIDECMAQFGDDLPCRYLCTGNVSMPRRLFEGGLVFNEGFAGYSFEDTELGYRLARQGVRFRYLPEASAEHRTDTSVEALLSKQAEAGRSAVRFLQAHPEAAEHLETPYEVPGVVSTRRRDSMVKRLVKALYFSRPAGMILETLLKASAALGIRGSALRLLYWAGYARYGRAYRREARAAARLAASSAEPARTKAVRHG